MWYYSIKTKGFYTDAIHTTEQIPNDAVGMTDNEYKEMFALTCQGYTIANEDGKLIGVPPDYEKQKTAHLKRKVEVLLAESDKTMVRIFEAVVVKELNPDAPEVVAWASYRRNLRFLLQRGDIKEDDVPLRPDYPPGNRITGGYIWIWVFLLP